MTFSQVIAMDGMYAGFAGAKTGHRGVTFCGCAVICFTVFLALVALAAIYRCYQYPQGFKAQCLLFGRSGAPANTPWNRVRLTLGFGTRAASRAMKSSGPKIRQTLGID